MHGIKNDNVEKIDSSAFEDSKGNSVAERDEAIYRGNTGGCVTAGIGLIIRWLNLGGERDKIRSVPLSVIVCYVRAASLQRMMHQSESITHPQHWNKCL